jgi:hypothetical protein
VTPGVISSDLFSSESNSAKNSNLASAVSLAEFKDADFLTSLSILLDGLSIPKEQEEQAIFMLNIFTREIIPETTAMLPASVVSLRPLLAQGAIEPVRLSACPALDFLNQALSLQGSQSEVVDVGNNGSKLSALYYDPFAARKKSSLKAKPVEALWPVNFRCRLVVVLNNPLSVALQLDNLCVVMTGVPHKVYPCSVTVPAHSSTFEVELFAKPFQIGELKVVGIKVFVNNAMQIIQVDDFGSSIKKR